MTNDNSCEESVNLFNDDAIAPPARDPMSELSALGDSPVFLQQSARDITPGSSTVLSAVADSQLKDQLPTMTMDMYSRSADT